MESCSRIFLDLNVLHLTQETVDRLEANEADLPLISRYPFGYFLYIPKDEDKIQALPEDLQEVIAFAKAEHATIIRVDIEGRVSNELNTYSRDI